MPPSILYKYVSASTARLVLEKQSLRWSSPQVFNDILEFQRFPSFSVGAVTAIPAYLALLAKAAAREAELDEARLTPRSQKILLSFRSMIAAGRTSEQLIELLPPADPGGDLELDTKLLDFFDTDLARVLCLTDTPTNGAMWGNYADNHAGCVLGLRSIEDSAWLEAKPVDYVDSFPPLGSGIDLHLYGHTPEMLAATLQAVCFSKQEVWSYEREWRVVTWARPDETGLYSQYTFLPDEVESVTFGARTTAVTESSVREIVAKTYADTLLYRMVTKNGRSARISAD